MIDALKYLKTIGVGLTTMLFLSGTAFGGPFSEVPKGELLEQAFGEHQCYSKYQPNVSNSDQKFHKLKGKTTKAMYITTPMVELPNNAIRKFQYPDDIRLLAMGKAKFFWGVDALILELDSHKDFSDLDKKEIRKMYRHSQRIYRFFSKTYGHPILDADWWTWIPLTYGGQDSKSRLGMITTGDGVLVMITCP